MPSKVASKNVDMSDLADDLLDSDVENVEQAPTHPVINRTVVKKSTASTKPKSVVKKTATKSAVSMTTKPTKETKAQREALKDRTNTTHDSDIEEEDAAAPEKPKTKRVRPAKGDVDDGEEEAPPAKKRVAKPKTAKEEIPDSQVAVAKVRKPKMVKRVAKPEPETVPTIPETQQGELLEDVSHSVEQGPQDMDVERVTSPVVVVERKAAPHHRSTSQQLQQQQQRSAFPMRARSTSVQPRNFSRSRGGSVSDSERRIADGEAKKKLHEMTCKYEDMRMKHDSLQELAQNAAESNFDKLKKASDEKTKDANNLIASLKREINDLRKTSSNATTETARLQSQLSSLETSHEKSLEDAKLAAAALLDAQNEVKALTAKLDAARKAVQAPLTVDKTPATTRHNNVNASTAEATKHAALKEELYRDLTGLIINSVKRRDGEDEYSCIQTGRNGTLHFHLTVCNDSSSNNNPKTPSGLSYEETEFAYEPLLDEGRDGELVDLLPDYLTEEICFPRAHAVKFYTKVVESMTKRVVVEDE